MQLFICPDLEEQGSEIIIKNNPELVLQLKKVLRAKPWYVFYVQYPDRRERFQVALTKYTDTDIFATLLKKEQCPYDLQELWMVISFPNKQEKLELIIQKLTEIWVSHLYLRRSERSQFAHLNENKLKRIQKIMQEAVEQSRWWEMPKIDILEDLHALRWKWNFAVFDLEKEEKSDLKQQNLLPSLWVIWPEGGLSPKDYEQFPQNYQVKSLGNTVLRMETAAIIGAWYLKRYKKI